MPTLPPDHRRMPQDQAKVPMPARPGQGASHVRRHQRRAPLNSEVPATLVRPGGVAGLVRRR
jgi:hypothetical protein